MAESHPGPMSRPPSVGHAIRTPLTVVRVQVQLTRRRLDRGTLSDAQVRAALTAIDAAVDRLVEHTRRMDFDA